MDGHPLTSIPDPSSLVTVRVVTTLGAEYLFPDLTLSHLKELLPETGRLPSDQTSLVLINASAASLIVPMRIISEVSAGGEVLWRRPA